MPIGENVISIGVMTVMTSSVKAVRGIRAGCGVMGSFTVVFRRMLQNATSLGAVWVVEPLIKQVPAYCVAICNSVAYCNSIFTITGYIFSLSDEVWIY